MRVNGWEGVYMFLDSARLGEPFVPRPLREMWAHWRDSGERST